MIQRSIDTVRYNTALFLQTHNKIHVNTNTRTQHIFILFDDNTSRSYSPYSTLKSFLLYSIIRYQYRSILVLFSAHKTSKNRSKSIEKSIVIDRKIPKRIHSFPRQQYSSSPQVLKPFLLYSLQDQESWIARLIDRILSIKVQAAVSVYCALLHLTLVITSRYTGQHT